MAKETEITVDVKVTIPDKTILRCVRLLEMWMDDNQNKRLLVDRILADDGYHHKIRIGRWEADNGGDD